MVKAGEHLAQLLCHQTARLYL